MKNRLRFISVLLLMSLPVLACGVLTPTETAPQVEAGATMEPGVGSATQNAIPVSSPVPTTGKPEMEIVQTQTWTDRDGNVRVNVLLHNPYEYPVAPGSGAGVSLLNGAGESIRGADLYFLDGISGGSGFILPGETIAATSCFTCERDPLTEEWASVKFVTSIVDATDRWDYHTDVEATIGDVSFDGDSPIFWASGTVTNNGDLALARISVRIFVFDQAGDLIGAAEVSAWDVGAGATASFNGYGIGQAPDGPVTYEVTALGVNY